MSDLISRADAIEAVDELPTKDTPIELYEVYRMAINDAEWAIDALPSADAVSREWYDDAVKANHELAFTDLPDIPRYYYEKVVGKMAHEINVLKEQLESADAEWILCSERLPKEGQMVLTTIRGHDVIIPQDGETLEEAMERVWNEVCYVSVGFIGSDGWYGADGFPQIVHPIAWMPLPKPYREDGEV